MYFMFCQHAKDDRGRNHCQVQGQMVEKKQMCKQSKNRHSPGDREPVGNIRSVWRDFGYCSRHIYP